jgi:uncharacterized protein (DUF58 family)
MTSLPERLRRTLHRFTRWDTGLVVRVTNTGLGFVVVTLVVAVGATNTGNNGLYVLLALCLSILVVSGVLSRRNVDGLVPGLDGPDELFAGEPARFGLTVANDRPRERSGVLVTLDGLGGPWLFPSVRPGTIERRGVDLVFPSRGPVRVPSVLLFSSYPIGLFRKGWRRRDAFEGLAYPRPAFHPLPEPDDSRTDGDGGRAERRGRGAGIRNLRDAQPGDDPRDIHWRQTARQGSPIVRERDSEETRDSVVVVERGGGEEAVSEAAGAVLQLLARGDRVGVAAGHAFVAPGAGPGHRRALLGTLALADPAVRPEMPPLAADVSVYTVRGAGAARGPGGVR